MPRWLFWTFFFPSEWYLALCSCHTPPPLRPLVISFIFVVYLFLRAPLKLSISPGFTVPSVFGESVQTVSPTFKENILRASSFFYDDIRLGKRQFQPFSLGPLQWQFRLWEIRPEEQKLATQNFMISTKPQKFDISCACMIEIREVGRGRERAWCTLKDRIMEGMLGARFYGRPQSDSESCNLAGFYEIRVF